MFFTETHRKVLTNVEERVTHLERSLGCAQYVDVNQIQRNFNTLAERVAFLEAENERLTKKRKPCSTCGHREKVN